MTPPLLTFGAFGPLEGKATFPTTRINVQLINLTVQNIGNGKTVTTLTLWDGLREIGKRKQLHNITEYKIKKQ